VVDYAVAQHVERAPLVDLRRQAGDELRLRAGQAAVELLEPLPRVGLGGADELEQVLGVDPCHRFERRRPCLARALEVVVAAVLDQPCRHVFLERCLVRLHCVTSSGNDLGGRSSDVNRSRNGEYR
jgi:hypothetical protein